MKTELFQLMFCIELETSETKMDFIPPQTAGYSIVAFFFLSIILFLAWRSSVTKAAKLQQELGFANRTLSEISAQLSSIKNKYSGIIDIDSEITRQTDVLTSIKNEIEAIRASYREKKAIYDQLEREIAIFDEKIELSTLGYYEPHFDFGTSERFKAEIEAVRALQKDMLSAGAAAVCETEWRLNNSVREGKTMVNRAIKLTLRAFNNECDAAVANVRWNNISRMEERISKAKDAINKLNKSNNIEISENYFALKLNELRLTYEYADKLRQEKEEQAEERRRLREEQQLIRDQENAEKEERKFALLVEKAKAEAEKATGEDLAKLQNELADLERQLAEAQAKTERALSMAQQTKSGYVYVISNIGSFGHDVYKIGMTRRLEPMDRVRELGDASVPFTFDVHALVYSEDAPSLESELHRHFDKCRLNMVNNRKEFFRVPLKEIETRLKAVMPDIEILEAAEAQDYHQTLLIHNKADELEQQKLLP
ncbi:DUF4041 domain-containing protein, partial [Rheinheimera aquimaris]